MKKVIFAIILLVMNSFLQSLVINIENRLRRGVKYTINIDYFKENNHMKSDVKSGYIEGREEEQIVVEKEYPEIKYKISAEAPGLDGEASGSANLKEEQINLRIQEGLQIKKL